MASRPRLAGRTASAAYGPYYIVDFLHLAGASPSDSSSGDAALGGSSGCCGRLRALLLKLHLLEALYLVLVGVLSAVLALFVNLFADKLAAQRERLLSSVDHIFHRCHSCACSRQALTRRWHLQLQLPARLLHLDSVGRRAGPLCCAGCTLYQPQLNRQWHSGDEDHLVWRHVVQVFELAHSPGQGPELVAGSGCGPVHWP
eukprot:m.190529 g.190529  ORF g.190529 m.190529 type:complete len:201 (+) comp10582_c0_seq5:734-1336(+)